MELEIRPLRADEIEALADALPAWRGLPLHRERFDRQESGEALYLTAWDGPDPVGHLFLLWQADPFIVEEVPAVPGIGGLNVREDRQSRGIGTALTLEAERRIVERGERRAALAVAVDNVRARDLYDRLGYSVVGRPRRKRSRVPEDPGEDCVVMVKTLVED